MFALGSKIVSTLPSADKLYKNIRFGTAMGLTKTAKEGQAAVQDTLKTKFTLRGKWFEQQTPIGIKITPANRDDLKAKIHTTAPFLARHEHGETKLPYKNYLALPTKNARRTPTARIRVADRPANLKNAFIIVTKSTGARLLCVRRGRGRKKDIVPMYLLIPKAKIKQVDIWDKPIKRVIDHSLDKNIAEGVDKALKTMR